jgi:nucleoside-diphosphate-sugar epimerase
MNVLVTGTNSGLGKWLSTQFLDCDKLTRDTNMLDLQEEYDIIIHSAANVNHASWEDVTFDLFTDNVFLTRDLANIPHKKFVFISSIDHSKNSPYGVSKKVSEIVVKKLCNNYLIIRPSALLGKEMRKNTFQRIISGEDIVLTPNSIMNYILYEDILRVIEDDVTGTKNLVSNESITMQEVADIFEKDINFGKIHFEISPHKSDINTNKTSKDNVVKFQSRVKYEK